MKKNEKELIKRFAAGDQDLREPAITIFRRYLSTVRLEESLEMRFMSEIDNVCPDLALRAMYRKQLTEAE